ncbi:MAG: DUF99 family protein [Myxococcales bacterium]|nr:DUF99 family protein [Myxococcales bacterium]MCB9583373.1 DUF99 family protein [Polyangiaceae bacterium]
MGVDDAPFARDHRGDVAIVGTVCSRTRLDGVLTGRVRRDGKNAATRIADMLVGSPFDEHVQAVVLQGIAVGGFNVVDVHALHARVGRPVLVVARRKPNLAAMRRALLERVPGGREKWRLLERAGEMEPLSGVYVQRVGLTLRQAEALLASTTLHGNLPEPLRLAHIIAGGLATGVGRGGA